jgi:ribosomal protein L11 methyltransferase
MPFLALRFDLARRDPHEVEARCFALGAHSITFSDQRDDAVLEPLPGEVRLWPATRVEALFDGDSNPATIAAQLAAEIGLQPGEIDTELLADRAWEREWLRDFHAMRFGHRLWICPQHETVMQPDAVVVRLDPGLAFGTGTHPSTALCLAWLDGNLRAGERMVDYGCGSGVLGIAAARLGADHIDAVDVDPQALLATADNAERNFVGHQFTLHAEAARIPPAADLVVANILASTLIELAPRLAALVRPGGRLLLAGILQNQTLAVTAAYDACFDIAPAGQREDWVLLCGTRNNNADCLS